MTTLSDRRRPDPGRNRNRVEPSRRSAIAVTIIGGQMLCLLLTLTVVPVGYSYIEQAGEYFRRNKHPATAAASPAMGD